jgi:hypothetical protein
VAPGGVFEETAGEDQGDDHGGRVEVDFTAGHQGIKAGTVGGEDTDGDQQFMLGTRLMRLRGAAARNGQPA